MDLVGFYEVVGKGFEMSLKLEKDGQLYMGYRPEYKKLRGVLDFNGTLLTVNFSRKDSLGTHEYQVEISLSDITMDDLNAGVTTVAQESRDGEVRVGG